MALKYHGCITIVTPLVLYRSWFAYSALYNLLFLGLQLGYVLSSSSSFINALPLPAAVYLPLITTVLVHLALYLLLSILQTTLLWGLVQLQQMKMKPAPLDWSNRYFHRWHMSIWLLTICALLTSNGYFFPLSSFSKLFLPELPHPLLMAVMLSSLFILSLLTVNVIAFAIKRYPFICASFSLIILCFSIFNPIRPQSTTNINLKPNIILIGVDSLSPSRVNAKDTPTLLRFIKNSVLFKETISPLAQTYPSWATILTGLYADHHKASYNLMPPDLVKNSLSIAWSLQTSGYQTIFATDDRRFNNMGKEFGFQKIIGPKVGTNDILLGSFNDFPLSNLFINLPISRWLFPYNYINRASYKTFYPQSFESVLINTIEKTNRSSPLFMAVHFTLPHWPYAWANSSPSLVGDEYNVNDRTQLYSAAIQRADQQVSMLLNVLEHNGFLENTMVVLLSDHGEAFYVKGSRQTSPLTYQGQGRSAFAKYLKRKTSTVLEKSVGHGSDLLSPEQYHCILAFKIYKNKQLITTPKIITTRVALIDLMPTIKAFLGYPVHEPIDGLSLLQAINNHHDSLPNRSFIMESGMLPNQFLSAEKAKQVGKKYFTIDPKNGELHLRKDSLATLDGEKLYGVISGDWILALYPDDDGYLPVILNHKSGQWADDLNLDFSKKSPAKDMLKYMQQFYQKKWVLAQINERTQS